jgi:hypothetical protein
MHVFATWKKVTMCVLQVQGLRAHVERRFAAPKQQPQQQQQQQQQKDQENLRFK